jgi:hypothetical protein
MVDLVTGMCSELTVKEDVSRKLEGRDAEYWRALCSAVMSKRNVR